MGFHFPMNVLFYSNIKLRYVFIPVFRKSKKFLLKIEESFYEQSLITVLFFIYTYFSILIYT